MRIVSIVLRVLVGVMFLSSAVMKLAGADDATREDLQLATWFWQFTGFVELIGAVALLASFWYPRLALAGGVWLVGLMVGAVIAHNRVDDPVSVMILPAVLLVLSATIAALAYREEGIGRKPVEWNTTFQSKYE